MRTYNFSLVQAMLDDPTHEEHQGLLLSIKRVPDEPRAGYPDPRFIEPLLARPTTEHAFAAANLTVEQMRRMMGSPNRNLNTVEIYTGFETLSVEGRTVGIWRYYPRKPFDKRNRPALVFFHGGGFVGGSPFAVENFCRLVAELAGAVVFNIDYALAPEHKFPQGLQDCYAAVCHVHDHAADYGIDPAKITVGGDSAGGNLSAACCLLDYASDRAIIKAQFLIYPAVLIGTARTPDFDWRLADFNLCAEYRAILEPIVLGFAPAEEEAPGFEALYTQVPEECQNPLASPLLAPDFTVFPRTLIATAEYDGLRVQGELFGRRLQAAGNPARVIRYHGVGHAFIDVVGLLPQAEALACEIAAELKQV
ncbi:MAG: alpha/beta hydrolase [Eubacteriales bacterium]|nr:alpha/beta hydrolase [Eubacteriales bacterium]